MLRGSIHTQLATRNVNLTFFFHTHPPTIETSIRGKKKANVNTRKYFREFLRWPRNRGRILTKCKHIKGRCKFYAFAFLKHLWCFSLFIYTNWTINLKSWFTVWRSKFICFVYFPWLGNILYRFVFSKYVLQILK